MMDAFVALMRRYCIDYTNSHDLTVVDEIMEPDYVVHIAGLSLVRDPAYKPAVEFVFSQFPGLGLAVHEMMTNGERLAMRFTEHAATAEGKLCCWAGISLYRWNRTRLTECRVEQDFLSRQRQLASGRPEPLEPPHLDPWMTTRPVARDASAERTVADWLRAGDFAKAAAGRIDDADLASFDPVIEPKQVEILDAFSAGNRVAFHARASGRYRGGLPDADEKRGQEAHLDLAGIATVAEGKVAEIRMVTDRLGTGSRLTGRPMF